ncbi:MAG: hypothetical protein H0T84_07645 [Tatlockia sp.]|nr:hypothetical protein [Tatlockia sp.]
MAKRNILNNSEISNVDNIYSFYSASASKLGGLAVLPSIVCAGGGFMLGWNTLGENAAGFVYGAMLGGLGFLLSLPISIPTFGLALILALPLVLVFPLALAGAAIADALQGNEDSLAPSI